MFFVPIAAGAAGGPVGLTATLVASLAATAVPILKNMLSGKSATQKQAEYDLSAATNEIEKALDINSLAFRAGFTSQADASEIYEMLWGRLVQIADLARPYTAAQAFRTIQDRDYGGKFANVWRGTFRDDRILGIPPEQMENGWVLPAYRWDVDIDVFKYGGSASNLLPDITPAEIAAGPGAAGAGRGIGKVLPWAAALGGLWWLFK